MPADKTELEAMLSYAYRRGRWSERRRHVGITPPQLKLPCEDHDATGPVKDCLKCLETNSYCPHGSLMLHHFRGARPEDDCWRPRYEGEVEGID